MMELTLEDAIKKAIELEEHGLNFYIECEKKTNNAQGKDMFSYLAKEEVHHKERLKKYLEDEVANPSSNTRVWVPDPEKIKEEVFKPIRQGLDEKSDEIDALNVGVEAETQSIRYYKKLEEQCNPGACQNLFVELVNEEEKHLAILTKEVEFVTETGEYYDFKTVTM
ncbi:MAG: ferritin family protein [Candidatus Altiarchaeota archaeon]